MSNKVALDLLKSSGRIVIGSFQKWPHNLFPKTVPRLMVPVAIHIVCTSLGFQARNPALLLILLPLPHLRLLIKSRWFHLGFQTWVHTVLPPSGVSLSSQSTAALVQTLPMSWTEQLAPNTPSCLVCPQCSAFSFGHVSDLKNELDHVTPLCKDFLLLPWLQNMVFHIWPKYDPQAPASVTLPMAWISCHETFTQLCRHATPFQSIVPLHVASWA